MDGLSIWVIKLGFPNNYFIINLYAVIGAPVIYAGFYKHLQLSQRNKKWYKIFAILLTAGFVIDYFFINDFNKIDAYSLIVFYFINIILCCGWLFKTAMKDEIFRFDREPLFWISSGLLIFSIGTLITLGMNQFIRINQLTIQNQFIYRIIMPVLNVILYSSFTYAFLLCRLRKKSYSSS